MKKLDQNGFHVVEVAIVVVVLGGIGLASWKVFGNKKQDNPKPIQSQNTQNPSSEKPKTEANTNITWEYNDTEWKPNGTAPECPSQIISQTPVDLTKVNAILYPGQTRNLYKPHGGFLMGNVGNDVTVKAPMDSKLYEGSRYIESGEVQYLLVFQAPCGIMYRFDHLYTLSDVIQKIVDSTLPAAKVDDSRTTKFAAGGTVKAGDIIATVIGHKNPKNVGFDFGVYDLRQRNEASKSASYQSAHQNVASQAFYGVCWLDWLPGKDAATAKALPGGDGKAGKASDYCK